MFLNTNRRKQRAKSSYHQIQNAKVRNLVSELPASEQVLQRNPLGRIGCVVVRRRVQLRFHRGNATKFIRFIRNNAVPYRNDRADLVSRTLPTVRNTILPPGVDRPVYHISSINISSTAPRARVLVHVSPYLDRRKTFPRIIPEHERIHFHPAGFQASPIRLSFLFGRRVSSTPRAAWILAYGQEYLWYYLAKLE